LLSDPAAIVDGKGNFFIVNDAFEEVTGVSRKELIGNPFVKLNIFTAETKAVLLEHLKKRLQRTPVEPYEVCFTAKRGEDRCVEVKGKRVSFAGQPANLVVFHDVSLRKENARRLKEYSERMEALVEEKVKEIQEKEEKFRNLAEHSPNMIFICQKGKVVYANTEAEKGMGYSKEEFYSSEFSFLDLITPENRELVVSNFAKHTKGEDTAPYEYGLMTKDGRRIDAILNTKIITYNEELAILGIVTDITERKQMSLKLVDAEQRYHALFDEAPLGVLVIDPQTAKPVEFNYVTHTQLGYSREEFSKLCISDFEVKEKADETKAHLAKIVRQGGDEFETKHRTKNGEIRNVLVTTRVVELAGKPFLYCVFHDITEIRKVQDALMESETQYRQLVNAAQEGIWALDSSYDTVFVNPRMAQMLGYAESEMVGKNLCDFLDPQTAKMTKLFLCQPQPGGVQFEYEFPMKDGPLIYTSLSMSQITDDDGKRVGTLALVADITEREKAESSLKSSEEKFRNLAEQSPNMIFINQKGRIVYANREAEEATGYKKEEFYSPEFNFMDLIAPESKELAKSKFIKHMKGEIGHQYEYKLISKKGRTIDVINNQKVIDYNGEPAILGIVTDITESKRLKEKLEQYSMHLESLVKERTAKLEQAQAQLVKSERLVAIGELAGMVGHDLRNPLTGIKNAAYYLKKKGVTCPEGQAKEMLEIIDKAIDHSNKIINDLLDYSREMHLDLTECTPHTLLEEAVRMIQVPDRIEIVNHVLEESRVRVDADKMMRVFINLIKNAVDAMPEKGTLEITSHKTKDNLEIAFADTGMGIPDETLPKIFSPLFTTKAQGMGFGLAICKRIVESHGGTITVKTAVNKGTTFTITLPIKPKLEVRGEKTWINMPESLLLTTTRA